MTLPILLFQPGTHGNFLARCLSVASGKTKDIKPVKVWKGVRYEL
jgi:hypothetical protein